jgi:hypothetical protein
MRLSTAVCSDNNCFCVFVGRAVWCAGSQPRRAAAYREYRGFRHPHSGNRAGMRVEQRGVSKRIMLHKGNNMRFVRFRLLATASSRGLSVRKALETQPASP